VVPTIAPELERLREISEGRVRGEKTKETAGRVARLEDIAVVL
jgi:hypothetical protein